MNQNWAGLLNPASQVVTAAPYVSSAAIADVSPLPDYTSAAGSLVPGTILRISANGVYSTTGTPTLLLQVMYGGTGGTALLTSGTITTISGAANTLWQLESDYRVMTGGTAGTLSAFGTWTGLTAATSVAQAGSASVGVNTLTSNAIILAATWGTSSASNTLTCHQFLIEQLN